MKNFNKDQIMKISLVTLIILVVILAVFAFRGKKVEAPTDQNIASSTETTVTNTTTNSGTKTTVTKNTTSNTTTKTITVASKKCGFRITNPAMYTKVAFPLTVTGVIDMTDAQNAGCTWKSVESMAGTAELYYNLHDTGWKSVGTSVSIKVSNSLASTSTLTFSVPLNIYAASYGLTSGTPLKVRFIENQTLNKNPNIFDFYLYLK